MDTHAARRLAFVSAVVVAAGCEQATLSASRDAERGVSQGLEGSQDFGDYIVYFNALNTDRLTPEVASQHAIVRSRNRAMLTVSVHRKQPGALTTAVSADVSVSAVNLTGQLKPMVLREIVEGDAIYYVGDLAINNGETLIYTIDVTPANETNPLSLRYQQRFFVAE